jgi:hypothetical protein
MSVISEICFDNKQKEVQPMIQFLLQHQFWAAVGAYWLFSAAVSAMPEPGADGRPGYLWLYRFLHTTAGNITTVFGSRIPGVKTIGMVLVAVALLSTTACAAHYAVHPGALNVADSAAYDTLLIAENVIEQARAGPLSTAAKAALDALVQSYNVALESWLTYRSAIQTNTPSDPYFQQLTKNLTDLTNAIRAIEEVKQ